MIDWRTDIEVTVCRPKRNAVGDIRIKPIPLLLFRYAIAADVANGMAFLHHQNIIHGNLTTLSCMIDSHMSVKIVDWEYTVLYDVIRKTKRNRHNPEVVQSVLFHINRSLKSDHLKNGICAETSCTHCLLLVAPELRRGDFFGEPTRAGDVFNFGLIIGELFGLKFEGNFSTSYTTASQSQVDILFRALSDDSRIPNKARQLIYIACSKDAVKRPTFKQLEKSLRSAVSSGKATLIDRWISFSYFALYHVNWRLWRQWCRFLWQ